jgi:hypothetical protein
LRQQEGDLKALGVQVAVVTFEAGPVVQAYARETNLSWPILIDASRSLYAAYGMERGRGWRMWGPHLWPAYIKLLVRGRKLHFPTDDVRQLGGDVLIDPAGIVRLRHISSGPADRPAVSSILQVLRSSLGTSEPSAT